GRRGGPHPEGIPVATPWARSGSSTRRPRPSPSRYLGHRGGNGSGLLFELRWQYPGAGPLEQAFAQGVLHEGAEGLDATLGVACPPARPHPPSTEATGGRNLDSRLNRRRSGDGRDLLRRKPDDGGGGGSGGSRSIGYLSHPPAPIRARG
ncbi:unnamed protein product, partial [Ectocarpus sp. 12 AP-2014]